MAARVEQKQLEQKKQHDLRAKSRTLRVGDHVFVKNFSAGRRWIPCVIVEMSGPLSFRVNLEEGRRKRCPPRSPSAQSW